MRIKENFIEETTIEKFAEKHDLTMLISERNTHVLRSSPIMSLDDRFYARFESVEVMEGGCLRGTFGNGPTPSDAIAAYAEKLSERRIAYKAHRPDRENFDVPRLVHPEEEE